MASLEELIKLTNSTSSGATNQSPADRLADMRPSKPIPGRVITHSYKQRHIHIDRENGQSFDKTLQHSDE